jgi:hypothetical protein
MYIFYRFTDNKNRRMGRMKGTILRREILEDTSDRTRCLRAWLQDWSENAVHAIEYLGLFSHRDSYGGDWADILFKEGKHIVPADEFEKAMLLWLNTNAGNQYHIFVSWLWELFFGVYRRDQERIVFKETWRWFIDHKAFLKQNPHSAEYHFQQILKLIPEQ